MAKRYVSNFTRFNENKMAKGEVYYYYGVADCNGLDSFARIRESDLQMANMLDQLKATGIADLGGASVSEVQEYRRNLGMMKMRMTSNLQRHPIMFRVRMAASQGDKIADAFRRGDQIGALNLLKKAQPLEKDGVPNLDIELHGQGIGTRPNLTDSDSEMERAEKINKIVDWTQKAKWHWNKIPNPQLDPMNGPPM